MGPMFNAFAKIAVDEALKCGYIDISTFNCRLKSGRIFRYDLSGYRIPIHSTDKELCEICTKILNEKYRNCAWDRSNPNYPSESEIYDHIFANYKIYLDLAREILSSRTSKRNIT